jgi:hypothetical protein
MHTLTQTALSQLGEALKHFGTYSFDDKGASEVMDLDDLLEPLQKLPAKEAGTVLLELAKSPKYEGRGERLASELLLELQDWDELFENEAVANLM